jgi:tetratricopeptide (TPR) repeat protein
VQAFLLAVARNDLQTAVSRYTGELLPGFTCDSLLFEEWLLAHRESLHRQALDVFFARTEQLLAAGNLPAAQSVARQQLVLEPWREEAHRQLIRALVLKGERTAALAQFEPCRQILWDELGTEPDQVTLALFKKIEAGEEIGGETAVGALADFYQLRGYYAEAAKRFGEAVRSFTDGAAARTSVAAHLFVHQAGALIRLSRFDEAIEAAQQALSFAGKAVDSWVTGRAKIYRGEIHWRQGQYKSALNVVQAALTLAEAKQLPRIQGLAHLNLGIIYDFTGEFEKVHHHLHQAQQIWETLADIRLLGFTFNSQGVTAYHQHQLKDARIAYQKAYEMLQEIDDQQGIMSLLGNLGSVSIELKDFESAHFYLNESLQLALSTGENNVLAKSYYHLGWAAYEQEDYETAVEHLADALQNYKKAKNLADEGHVYKLIGDVEVKQGNIESAIEKYKYTLEICTKIGNLYLNCLTSLALAAVYETLNHSHLVNKFAQSALALAQKLNNVELEIQAEQWLQR